MSLAKSGQSIWNDENPNDFTEVERDIRRRPVVIIDAEEEEDEDVEVGMPRLGSEDPVLLHVDKLVQYFEEKKKREKESNATST